MPEKKLFLWLVVVQPNKESMRWVDRSEVSPDGVRARTRAERLRIRYGPGTVDLKCVALDHVMKLKSMTNARFAGCDVA